MAETTPKGSVDPAIPANNPFGAMADKSLESEVEEVKDAKEDLLNEDAAAHEGDEDKPDTLSVKMAHHADNEDGSPMLPGETYDVPRQRALALVASFRATFTDK